MCGITGILDWNGPARQSDVAKMVSKLGHRGPDAKGVWSQGPVALGHTRLSIVDLDPRAHQPFLDASKRFAIVFNGEIYNHEDLRRNLRSQGSIFRTQSDTEVLLEAWKLFGPKALDRLEGMFAFALWDSVEGSLHLARDRAGEKPLYFVRLQNNGVAFASELSALAQLPETSSESHPGVLLHFLQFGYMPTRSAVLDRIEKVLPAHFMTFSEGRSPEVSRYWDLRPFFSNKLERVSLDEAADELRLRIDTAVAMQGKADVEVGVLLSGGLDSSTIAASLAGQSGGRTLRAFSMGFESETFDETQSASLVAAQLGLNHHIDRIGAMTDDDLLNIAACQSEPLADTSYFPSYRLAGFARQRVKAVVGGDGADEILSGYPTHAADWLSRRLPGHAALWQTVRSGLTALPHGHGKTGLDFKLRQFSSAMGESWPARHPLWRQFALRSECIGLLNADLRIEAERTDFDPADFATDVPDAHYTDQAMYIDLNTWLVEDILVKVDRTSMQHGLEVRSPFLARPVLEYCARLPPDFRRQALKGKRILRHSQKDRLKPETLQKPKSGFNAPAAEWFANAGSEVARVFEQQIAGDPFDQAAVTRIWTEHRQKRRDWHLLLLAVFCYRVWQAKRAGAA